MMEFLVTENIHGRTKDGVVIELNPGQVIRIDPERANRLTLEGKIKPIYTGDPWIDLRDMWLRLNVGYNGELSSIQNSTNLADMRTIERDINSAVLGARSYSSCIAAFEGLMNKFKRMN